MPTTVNGIGTSYVGKRNRQVRSGVCRSCGRNARLESYDTRLWFVVIFVPVFPLGRKRIIDQCSVCRRHFVAQKDQYEVSRQLGISAARDNYRQNPSPATALQVHGTLLGFHDHTGAAEFRNEVLERFPDDAELNAGLASHLEQVGQFDEAARLFQRALELCPDLPQARVPVARQLMRAGKLDEARDLLQFLMARGSAKLYSLAPLEELAQRYQKSRRHVDALKLCQHIVSELPAVGQDHRFRKFVRASEKFSPSPESILPELKGGWLGLFNFKNPAYTGRQRFVAFAAVALLLLAIGLIVNNEHRRQHRTLHVFNAFAQPARVQIDGAETSVEPGQIQIPISEGHHQAKITGPIEQQVDFDVEAGYFARWFKDPVWVLNIGGAAILSDSTIVYAVNPQPGTRRLIIGEPFTYRAHVDYAFVAPPPNLQIEGHAQQVTKTHLDWLREDPSVVFSALAPKAPDVALAFAESQLTAHPDDAFLLEHYVELGADRGQNDRLEKFLKAGCSRRPIVVEWHRCYQDVLQRGGRQAQVVAEYDALLKSEPQNGRLLYLRGRIDPDHVHSRDFYLQATKAESNFAWPWYALGGQAYEEGQWRDALQLFQSAAERGFDARILAPMKHVARLALGDAARLEAEYREQMSSKPYDGMTLAYLCDTLAFQDKADDARRAFSEWEGRLAPLPADETAGEIASIKTLMLYQIGDLDGIRAAIDTLGDPSFAALRARMLIAARQFDEAARDERLTKAWDDPATALELSIGYSVVGNDKEAARWRDRACQSLEHRSPEELRAAQFLRAPSAPPVEEVMKASLFRPGKALILVALAMRFPESRASYGAAAIKLNVSHNPPYLTVKEAVGRRVAENPFDK